MFVVTCHIHFPHAAVSQHISEQVVADLRRGAGSRFQKRAGHGPLVFEHVRRCEQTLDLLPDWLVVLADDIEIVATVAGRLVDYVVEYLLDTLPFSFGHRLHCQRISPCAP